jgi:hypothetical protein
MDAMSPTSEPVLPPALAERLRRAQEEIRALVDRGSLTPADRLELASWQREWVAAWREAAGYIPAA